MSDPDHDSAETIKQLSALVKELQEDVKRHKHNVTLLQEERQRAWNYASKIKCRMQDIGLLLDGLLQDIPVERTMDKLLFVLNEEDRIHDAEYENDEE